VRVEVRIAGLGGQGIIMAGFLLAVAACIHGGRNAVQTRSYGPEARGGACRSDVVIDDGEIDYPRAIKPDILVAMSQQAYDRYADDVKPGGIIVLDPDLIPERRPKPNVRVFKVPARRIAEGLGYPIAANVVMLGALTSITGVVEAEHVRRTVAENVPRGMVEVNLKAFEAGWEYGRRLVKGGGEG